jgi:GTPase SAR1 family protein
MSHTPTIGVDFKSKTLIVSGNKTHGSKKIKLQLWDTAGQ